MTDRQGDRGPLAAAFSPLARLYGPRFSSGLHLAPSLLVSLGTHPLGGRGGAFRPQVPGATWLQTELPWSVGRS